MARDKARIHRADGSPVTWCMFCGAKVGQISDRTNKPVTAVYYCEKCLKNYCDQCSYEEDIDGKSVQLCLRCESRIERVT